MLKSKIASAIPLTAGQDFSAKSTLAVHTRLTASVEKGYETLQAWAWWLGAHLLLCRGGEAGHAGRAIEHVKPALF